VSPSPIWTKASITIEKGNKHSINQLSIDNCCVRCIQHNEMFNRRCP
jgi:hypothetical protein